MKPGLRLHKISPRDARIGVCSLPIARNQAERHFAAATIATQSVTLGIWPETAHLPSPAGLAEREAGGPAPRRNLVLMQSEHSLPEMLEGGFRNAQQTTSLASHCWRLEIKEIESIKINESGFNRYYKEVDELVLRHGDRSLGFRMGVQHGERFYWWQWVRIEPMWDGPVAAAYRVGGLIYAGRDDRAWVQRQTDKWLWPTITNKMLTANAMIILFANGVAQFCAHHINTRLFHTGEDLDGVPVFAFSSGHAPLQPIEMELPGQNATLEIATGVRLNMAEALPLCSRECPGRLSTTAAGASLLLYQPFQDARVTVGTVRDPEAKVDLPLLWEKGSTEKILRGVARTTRFTLSMGEAAPDVARFVAPEWWHSHCEESGSGPFLPVRGTLDPYVDRLVDSILQNQITGHFSDGGIWRDINTPGKTKDLSLNADEAGVLLQHACLRQSGCCHAAALRALYYAADIAIDHAEWIVHQHGNWNLFSLAYQRFGGLLTGYLETGDFYLRETAEAMAASYLAMDRFNWPTRNVGRDAEPTGGLALLWHYLGDRRALHGAQEVARRVAAVQEPDGSFAAQRGVGPCHGANALPGGPWMAGHAMNAVTEALIALNGNDPVLLRTLERYVAWIVAEWKKMGGHRTSTGMAARHFSCLAQVRNDPASMRDLFDNLNLWIAREDFLKGYHHAYFFVANVPFAEAMTLRARWLENGVLEVSPLLPGDDYEATILTPRGPVKAAFHHRAARFSADKEFPVRICWPDQVREITSQCTV
ncbi:MAG: hypothetical protein HY360_21800 [Verrucomicrobia bacterium]|nr:hypothetical protein [Verrucomicrobiota bacterium]